MNEQERVAAFIHENEMESPPAYRLLDLEAELGEISKEVLESTEYGATPGEVDVATDEIGDALFSLLAFAESVDVDAGDALTEAMAKYDDRLDESGSASSGV